MICHLSFFICHLPFFLNIIPVLTDKTRRVGGAFFRLSPLSTENLQETQEKTKDHENSLNEEFNRIIATFTIPENIDPILLEAWLRREKKAFLHKHHLETESCLQPPKTSLPFTYAGYLSVLTMMVIILLGLLNGTEPSQILQHVFLIMIFFFGIGFLFGWIIDNSIHESVRAMVLEVVHRSGKNEPVDGEGQ